MKANSLAHERKRDEEHLLPREIYFSESYFSQRGLYSLCRQLIEVYNTGCETLLEVGKGNGFVSEFLRSAGVKVTTVDINPSLDPDIVGSIKDLDEFFGETAFDCVLCAEVLEHMPFSDFESSLRALRKRTKRTCIVTVPRCDPMPHEIAVRVRLPFVGNRGMKLNFPNKAARSALYPGHHWELNCDESCSIESVRAVMLRSFRSVEDYRFDGNPYHQFFLLKI
jgi:hypothetical protein